MPLTIIPAFPKEKRVSTDVYPKLKIAECFSRTIQGEGFYVGHPAVFLRLQNCTLSCNWCDTTEVWRKGNEYSTKEILDLWEEYEVIKDLRNGHHLVLTGGSPLLQQDMLCYLFLEFEKRFSFTPITEIENECTLMPSNEIRKVIHCWNNSPKLSNSGMKKELRYKPQILSHLAMLENSWFKFVVSSGDDWEEIKKDFILGDSLGRWEFVHVPKSKIILMPEGTTRDELRQLYSWLVDLAAREGVRVTDRLHITVWDKTVGV